MTIAPATGKLGVLIPGIGAVSTTLIAGVEAIKRGISAPIGSLTQMGRLRLGKRTENRSVLIRDFLPLATLDDLCFGGWDLFPDRVDEAAEKASVLDPALLAQVKPALAEIVPYPAVFDPEYVTRLQGTHVKTGATKRELAEALREDIRDFRTRHGCERLVMVWCASTERFVASGECHQTLEAFERARMLATAGKRKLDRMLG
jgi:myo-inositol-1-phosphate synthase